MSIINRVERLESDMGGNRSGDDLPTCGKGVMMKRGLRHGYCAIHQSECWTRHDPQVWAGVLMGLEALEFGLPQPDLNNPSPEQVEAARQQLLSEGREVLKDGEEPEWVGVDAATIVEAVRILDDLGLDLSDPSGPAEI